MLGGSATGAQAGFRRSLQDSCSSSQLCLVAGAGNAPQVVSLFHFRIFHLQSVEKVEIGKEDHANSSSTFSGFDFFFVTFRFFSNQFDNVLENTARRKLEPEHRWRLQARRVSDFQEKIIMVLCIFIVVVLGFRRPTRRPSIH